jgi:ABC-2 type transport system ATP-binding protein
VTPAIETEGLTKRFRSVRSARDVLLHPWRRPTNLAVDAVSLRIERGELFGLLGPNGAGKTTLIRMLTTALVPTGGSARVAGHDVVRDVQGVRASIALVPSDDRTFFARLSGRANLEFFAALRPVQGHAGRIDGLLERMGLSAAAERPFSTYSSGMRQKLAIARGLLGDPAVLFLDEPTRSLDPISARDVTRLVSEYIVGELGRTVVLATHSLAEAEELCHRVAFVRGGRVVAEGTVDDLRRSFPGGVRCELRVRDMAPDLPGMLRGLAGVVAVSADRDERMSILRLTLVDEGPVLAAVLRETVTAGGDVHGCATRRASLEEIYFSKLAEAPPAAAVARPVAEVLPC